MTEITKRTETKNKFYLTEDSKFYYIDYDKLDIGQQPSIQYGFTDYADALSDELGIIKNVEYSFDILLNADFGHLHHHAVDSLRVLFSNMGFLNEYDRALCSRLDITEEVLDMKLYRLHLAPRAFNCLKHRGIEYIWQLIVAGYRGIKNFDNLGPVGIKDIINKLDKLGYDLKGAPTIEELDDIILSKKNDTVGNMYEIIQSRKGYYKMMADTINSFPDIPKHVRDGLILEIDTLKRTDKQLENNVKKLIRVKRDNN